MSVVSPVLIGLSVFLGGGIGASMRYFIGVQVAKFAGTLFPYGTLLINITGSFVIGIIASYFSLQNSDNQVLRLFLIVGVLGGFTTFSSFSLETLILLQRGELVSALGYIASSVLVSLVAVYLGAELAKLG